jgi:hypothetical protein
VTPAPNKQTKENKDTYFSTVIFECLRASVPRRILVL